MASIRVLVNPLTPHGKMIVESVDALLTVQSNLARVRGMMEQAVRSATDLLPQDFQPLANELGCDLPTAQDIFYLLAAAQAKVVDPVLVEFTKRCDQGG